MYGELKVKIQSAECWLGVDVWIYYEVGRKIFVLRPKKKEFVEVATGSKVEPTIYLPEDCLKPLAEALDQKGIRIDKEAVREGELKATKFHLEDLRTLLKLKELK